MELVIMAAGLGTRFGGLKQLEPIDKTGNFIIDYSINDAIRCGFDKVIFVIKKETFALFKSSIGNRIENKINVEYVFQDDEKNIPAQIPKERISPLGTGHAIYCVKDIVKLPFIVINADDFYGYEAFKDATNFIKNNKESNTFGLVCYDIENTIYGDKPFNRGVCFEDRENNLIKIIECSVQKKQGKIMATNKSNNLCFKLCSSQKVSMNLFVFYPTFFQHMEKHFKNFIKSNKKNLLNVEYDLSSYVSYLIKNYNAKIKLIKTNSKWFGMTYKEDKILINNYLKIK